MYASTPVFKKVVIRNSARVISFVEHQQGPLMTFPWCFLTQSTESSSIWILGSAFLQAHSDVLVHAMALGNSPNCSLSHCAQSPEIVWTGVPASLKPSSSPALTPPDVWIWAQFSPMEKRPSISPVDLSGLMGMGAAEMMHGNIRAPYTCKLISNPWHLCTNFPLPLKWHFAFWSWVQGDRDIFNLDSPSSLTSPLLFLELRSFSCSFSHHLVLYCL